MFKTKGRRIGLAVAIILALGVLEALSHRWREPDGRVLFVNDGTVAVRDLVVTFEGRDHTIRRIEPSEQASLSVGAHGAGPFKVTYKLEGGGLGGFNLPEYDPALLASDGQRLILVLKGNQFVRYQEDTRPGLDKIWSRVRDALAPYW